ncbi:hypothetical protein E1B28_010914 [Marasmius oreades]|uniref:Protein kinase domain-containing protein n=1 Tax=Marasmius oreades TaxID=181124 RepID=A0A9P7RTJ4_9AGAR|nr:uncharacterized protein E1B28_010914 [Marasmius oreades]KAG7089212.1 hypothetical protein E1B28_010914 [Marasmius oreades]
MRAPRKPTSLFEFDVALRLIQEIVDDHQRRKELLATRDGIAQDWLDLFQLLAEYPNITTDLRSCLSNLMIRLSRKSGLHPQCLTIRGVEKQGIYPVGGGAFGDVWKGKIGQQVVCLKVLRAFETSDLKQILKDYMQEAIIWRQLNHQNLLPFIGIYYLDVDQKQLCLVSPWMEQGNLVQFLKNTSPDVVDHDSLAYDVACGLSYLHAEKIVHGDLKGVNILITPDERACIGDFGLSRVSATQLLLSETTRSKGTTRWLSPELLRPEPSCVPSKESDIYAYACVCYEIFTGRIPFYELSEAAIVFAVLLDKRRPSHPENCTKLRGSMWDIMVACWNEGPSFRPTMVDVLACMHEMNADRRLKPASEWNDPAFTQIWSNAEQPPFLHGDEPIPHDRERGRELDYPFAQRDRKRFKHARPGGAPPSMPPAAFPTLPPPPSTKPLKPRGPSNTAATPMGHAGQIQLQLTASEASGSGATLIPINTPAGGFPNVDIATHPPEFKKEGSDWFAIFNPKIKKGLDVSLVHTLMHESVVCCVRFSPGGKYLATGCNRTVQIYNVRTGVKTWVLADGAVVGDLYIRSVCFSPDGKYLATGAEDKQIRIWDIAKRRIRNIFDGHQQEIYSLDFSSDGRLIVSGSGDKTLRTWGMDGTSRVFTINDLDSFNKDAGVTSVAISPNGEYVAAGSLDTVVRIWDVATGQLVEWLRGHQDSVYSVAFTPDGKGLVSGSLDKTSKYWDVSALMKRDGYKQSQCTMNFTGHKDYVLSVAVSHDGQWVVSGSKDRGVQFYDSHNATVQCMLQGHKNSVISVDFSPSGSMLATGSGDWEARIWSYRM